MGMYSQQQVKDVANFEIRLNLIRLISYQWSY